MRGDAPTSHARVFDEHAAEILRKRAESLAQVEESSEIQGAVRFLLFRLGDEWYAVPIENVREIHDDFAVTPLPGLPDHILGIINVRGEIISVMDLATLMRVERSRTDAQTVPSSGIIVCDEECVSLLAVDEIGDIIDVAADAIEPPIAAIDRNQVEFVRGSVHTQDTMVGIIDLAKVLTPYGESG